MFTVIDSDVVRMHEHLFYGLHYRFVFNTVCAGKHTSLHIRRLTRPAKAIQGIGGAANQQHFFSVADKIFGVEPRVTFKIFVDNNKSQIMVNGSNDFGSFIKKN